MSPEIATEIREGADNVELNVPYEIVNVEETVTDVSFYHGIRVELLSAKAKEGSIMLWKRPITGKGSKLGVFIILLGFNTDKWLHQWLIFKSWERNTWLVELTVAPVLEATKAKTAEGIAKTIKKA